MTTNKKLFIAFASLAMLGFSACKEHDGFKIEGKVDGGADRTILLEKGDYQGQWVAIDSVHLGSDGKFSIEADCPASPEIYRLTLDDRYIYLPIDSTETLLVETDLAGYGTRFSVSGTPGAELMAAFEKELIQLGDADSEKLSQFKRDVYTRYIKEGKGSIVAYYVLTKFFHGKPLYDPANSEDAKYYAAVATQFQQYRPDDPHGQMVKEVSLDAMRRRNSEQGKKTVVSASEMKLIDIKLPDVNGKEIALSQVAGKGKPVILVFSMMNEKESPVFNRELSKFYNAHTGTVEIYQVSFDTGRYEWRDAAANLPWINVIDPGGVTSNALANYNVGALPAIFVYNAAGELTARLESLDQLESYL